MITRSASGLGSRFWFFRAGTLALFSESEELLVIANE